MKFNLNDRVYVKYNPHICGRIRAIYGTEISFIGEGRNFPSTFYYQKKDLVPAFDNDFKTIMFWTLQMQFLSGEISPTQMYFLLNKKYPTMKKLNTLRYNGKWEDYQDMLATELALELSGLK